MVEVGTGSSGTRFIATDWPNTEGTTAGTTKQKGKKMSLEPEEEDLTEKDSEVGL